MGGSLRRNARRVCLSLAAVCTVLAFASPNVGAVDEAPVDDVPAPEVFSGNASAVAVSVALIQQYPVVPVPDLFNFQALEGMSTFASSSRAARASLFFPGNGGIIGPSLACGTFGAQFPEEFKPILDTCLRYQYPLSVTADDFQPDAATVGSLALGADTDEVSGDAILARAHAAEDGASSDAVMGALRVLGLPPFGALNLPVPNVTLDGSVATAENLAARTKQRIVGGVLVTEATTTISGLKLVGGIVRIGSIESVSKTTDDGRGSRSATADLNVSGVTVAGQPAKITNKGIVVSDPKNPTPLNKALVEQATSLVKQFDINISALPTEEKLTNDGPATASVGGLLVEFSRTANGLPLLPSPISPGQQIDPNGRYTVAVQLAQTGAKSTAASFGTDTEGEGGGITDDFSDVGDGSLDGDFGGDFASGDFGSDGIGSGGGDNGGSASGGAGRSAGGGTRTIAAVADTFGDRVGWIYLALMFSVLALCIAPRLALPARLPGPRE